MACLSRCQLRPRSAPITPPTAYECWLESCCAIFSLRVCCTQFCTIQQATGPQGVAWKTCEAGRCGEPHGVAWKTGESGRCGSLGSPVVEVAEANPGEGVHCCMPIELAVKALGILNPDPLDRTHIDHLTQGLVGGTFVHALPPAFEQKGQHLIWSCVVGVEHALSGEHLRALEVSESMRFHLSTQCFRARLLVCLRNPVSRKTNSSRFQVRETRIGHRVSISQRFALLRSPGSLYTPLLERQTRAPHSRRFALLRSRVR